MLFLQLLRLWLQRISLSLLSISSQINILTILSDRIINHLQLLVDLLTLLRELLLLHQCLPNADLNLLQWFRIGQALPQLIQLLDNHLLLL